MRYIIPITMKTLSEVKELRNHKEISNFDILLVAQVLDPTVLEFTNDINNRYTFNDSNLINLVKVAYSKNLKKLNWLLTDSIQQTLQNFVISVEQEWSHLLKIRAFADKVREKMNDSTVLCVEDNSIKVDGMIYSEARKKTYGTNLLLDTLFGVDASDLKRNSTYWDQLIQAWLYLIFRYVNPTAKNWIEEFIFDNQIYNVDWEGYFNIETAPEWRVVGLYVPPLNKNYKVLHELLNDLVLYPQWWINFEEFKNKWFEFKNNHLNKKIIYDTVQLNLDKSAFLKGVKHVISDQLDARDYEYQDLKKQQLIPTRNQILDLPISIKPSFWANDIKDYTYILTCMLNDVSIGDIVVEIGWQQIGPAKNLKHKIRFQKFNVDSLRFSNNS